MLASLKTNLSKLNYFELLLPHTTIRLDILKWQRPKENWNSSFKTLNLKPLGVFLSIELLSDLTRSHVVLRNTSITQMLSRQTIWIAYKSVEGGKAHFFVGLHKSRASYLHKDGRGKTNQPLKSSSLSLTGFVYWAACSISSADSFTMLNKKQNTKKQRKDVPTMTI